MIGKFLNNRKGVTLIELIVSLAIFGIIATAFISMFTSSLIWIYGAGDKTEAYSIAQQDIESRIATGDSSDTEDLVLVIGGESYTIRGGLIETSQSVNQKNSDLRTFVPSLPTIIINPTVLYEGYVSGMEVNIIGEDTNFTDGLTKVDILDSSGNNYLFTNIAATVTDKYNAKFTLPDNLLNGEYIVRVTTSVINVTPEISRAKLIIHQPRFMIAGESIFISADGINWSDRALLSTDLLTTFNMNAINYNGSRYVVVGDEGYILINNNNELWEYKNVGLSVNLIGVTWSSSLNKYFALGDNGSIYTSTNGSVWSQTNHNVPDITLKAISTTTIGENSYTIAVGDEGTIIYSKNELSWVKVDNGVDMHDWVALSPGFDTVGNPLIVLVGTSGYTGVSSDIENWVFHSNPNFIDVDYSIELGQFISVGGNSIYSSEDGISWNQIAISTENLIGVYTKNREVVAISHGGVVMYSNDGIIFQEIDTDYIGFNSVSGK